jgi:tetratricopeptide (TPR) repeat protein
MNMDKLRKRALGLAVAAGLGVGAAAPALASGDAQDRLDALFAELAEPDQADWPRIEAEIIRHWSRSGSAAMDLLLRRGTEAMEQEDWIAAVEHLSALVDHAPDFAEGWNARATAFYMMEEHALAIADIEVVLSLNPRHFGALSGLAVILEAMGDPSLALEAQRAALALHPHRPEVIRAVERLERRIGGAEL